MGGERVPGSRRGVCSGAAQVTWEGRLRGRRGGGRGHWRPQGGKDGKRSSGPLLRRRREGGGANSGRRVWGRGGDLRALAPGGRLCCMGRGWGGESAAAGAYGVCASGTGVGLVGLCIGAVLG